jgi:hypothetical protein
MACPSELRCAAAAAGLELIAAAAGEAAPRVKMLAYTGQPMKLDGFAQPVIVDLESLKLGRQSVPLLRDHDPLRIAGHTTAITVSQQRLKAEGVLSGLPAHTDEVIATAARGFPWNVSMGAALPARPEFVEAGSIKVNGRHWPSPILVARGAVLRELSLLPLGADADTSASFAAVPEIQSGTEKG